MRKELEEIVAALAHIEKRPDALGDPFIGSLINTAAGESRDQLRDANLIKEVRAAGRINLKLVAKS
jgi:hypothetical protein